jgi:hypothetical protein
MKKVLIWICMLFLLVLPFVSSYQFWCEQESVDTATSCGGLDSGDYSYSGGTTPECHIDGDWADDSCYWSDESNNAVAEFYYLNYSKPDFAIQGSKWQFKHKRGGTAPYINRNETIPASCWDYDPDFLVLRAVSHYTGSAGFSYYGGDYRCHNNTGWQLLYTAGTSYSDARLLFEEKIWWLMEDNRILIIPESVESVAGIENVTITWETTEVGNETIIYWRSGEAEDTYSNADFDTLHEAHIDGLAEGSTYYYNVSTCNSTGYCVNSTMNSYTFSTLSLFPDCYQETANVSTSCGGLDTGSYGTGVTNSLTYGNCYQETATASTSCGGLNTGSYYNATNLISATNFYDGIWTSYAYTWAVLGGYGWIKLNYTKPVGALNTSVWQIKDYRLGVRNMSIPKNCWNYDPNKLSFKVITFYTGAPYDCWIYGGAGVLWSCYNGTTWENISCGGLVGGSTDLRFYEDGMYWKVPQTNVTSYFYVNYTIPAGFSLNPIWRVKHGTLEAYNITIPDECFDGFSILRLRIVAQERASGFTGSYPQCYNSSGLWEDIGVEHLTFAYSPDGCTGDSVVNRLYDGNWSSYASACLGTWKATTSNTLVPIYEEGIYWKQPPSFSICFYDEKTNEILEGYVVEYVFWSPDNSFEGDTEVGGNTGCANIVELPTGVYRIDYWVEPGGGDGEGYGGYDLRHYYATITSSTTDFNLYGINADLGSQITVTVIDETDSPLPNFYVRALRQFVNDSGWKTVEIGKTDSDGQTLLTLEKNTVFYDFIVENEEGDVVRYFYSERQLSTDEITLRVRLTDDALAGFEEIQNVPTWLTYDNNTGEVLLVWLDTQDIVQEACLKIYSISLMRGKTLVSSTCAASPSGSLTYDVSGETDGHYLAEVWLDTNTGHSWYNTKTKELILGIKQRLGMTGALLGLLIIGVMTFLGLRSGNAAVTGLLLVVSVILVTLMGLIDMMLTGIISLIVIVGLLLWRKK